MGLLALLLLATAPSRSAASDAEVARSLVASNSWGVISTTSLHLNGTAFGNVMSFSDGHGEWHGGTPYFYMSPMDFTLQDIAANPACSLSISQLGTAGGCHVDPEDPTCAKLTLSGKMLKATGGRLQEAKDALFARHPDMAKWPSTHRFQFMYLQIETLFLLDHYGGSRPLPVEEYYSAAATSSDTLAAE
eukprot:CAMPEP_0117671070 /NCGR_PEP_ID=MMETSP0804-20121206/13122_1 /TAXON_ID=1074897 /ORGANISM="Tetraselmis astigmatica, Strain CCMP880" /LENGTH=189 /DNA_ID=CAMNT_0005479475 /DNA_START=251 /DNA_END=820 /DNA_ORIENTATION=-